METFSNVPGTTIAELTSNANFPNSPSATTELNEFRIPINVADDYGVRVRGLLKAPETGTYYFWVTGDDNVELSLSTDASPSNKTRIAYHESWSFDGEWNKFSTQKSAAINLVAGQNYYIEALMNERGGGDNLSVGWRKPSHGDGPTPFQVIPCTAFDLFNGPPVVNVTGVSISPKTLTLIEQETQQLTATVTPVDATDTSVDWSSSDDSIATVSIDGLVTAVAEGEATITVTTADGGLNDSVSITVEAAVIPVTGVTIDASAVTLTEGDTQLLTATVSPSDADNASVTWSSNDETIATVDTSGLVTAVSAGTATITVATADGDFTASSIITVQEAACIEETSILIDFENGSGSDWEASGTAPKGAFVIANPTGQSSLGVQTQLEDDHSAVGSNALFTATNTSVGSDDIDRGVAITTSPVYTIEKKSIMSIWYFFGQRDTGDDSDDYFLLEYSLDGGTTYTTLVSHGDERINAVWTEAIADLPEGSSLVVRVSASDGPSAGDYIEAGIDDFVIASSCKEPVPVTGIVVSPETLNLTAGETRSLSAIVSPANADNTSVTWSSSDVDIVTVDSNGQILAIAAGTATITATSTEGGFVDTSLITIADTSCNDGIQNGDETGIDCGGSCANVCPCEVEDSISIDFENGSGSDWVTSGTAPKGAFVIADPTGQSSLGVQTQLEDDHSEVGNNAFFTATNTSVGANDIDGGVVTATSPVYTIEKESIMSIWYFFGQRDTGDDPDDYFLLEYSLDGGISYTTLASHGDERINAVWTEARAGLPEGSSLVVRVSASDGSLAGDYIEAGIDDLVVTTVCSDSIGGNTGIISLRASADSFFISLVPNPATDIVNIEVKGLSAIAELIVFDMHGRQVFVKEYNTSFASQGNYSVNVSSLAKGVYNFHFTLQDGTVHVQKLIRN